MADKEYIELGALLLKIDLHGTNKFGMLDEDIRKFVKSIPTTDAVEVKHGEWVKRTTYPMGYNCSECNNSETYKSPFCRLCGAKMDGKPKSIKQGE